MKNNFLFILSFVFLTGCNYSISKNLSDISGSQAIEKLPTGTVASYQLIANGIIAPRCLECHSSGGGNQGGVNLESYSKVKANLADIHDDIVSGDMPKNRAPLTPKE